MHLDELKNGTEDQAPPLCDATVKETQAGSGRRVRLDNVERTVYSGTCSQLTCGKLPGSVRTLDLSLNDFFGLQE